MMGHSNSISNNISEGLVQGFVVRFFWIVPLAFYWLTASPHPGWIDSPMIANRVHILETGTWVNTHNLFFILGKIWSWIFPWGELHYKLNLLAGLFGAVAVYFLFRTGLLLSGNLIASVLGGLAIVLSHSLWWHSTMLEVYTLNAALIGIILYLIALFDCKHNSLPEGSKNPKGDLRYLYGAAFVWGLGVLNHALMGLFIFAFAALFIISKKRRELFKPAPILLFSFFFLCGFQIYIFLFLKELTQHVNRVTPFSYNELWNSFKYLVDHTTGGHFKGSMFPEYQSTSNWINWRLNYLFLLLINYPSVMFIFGFVGLWTLKKLEGFSGWKVFFVVGLIAQITWSANYIIWDMYAFGMPVWIMFGVVGIVGGAHLIDRYSDNLKRKNALIIIILLSLSIGPYLYASIPKWAQKEGGFWTEYFKPFSGMGNLWDAAEYFSNPNKRNYNRVKLIADGLFAKLPPGAIVFDDDGKGYYPFSFYYQQTLNIRRDIQYYLLFTPQFDDRHAAQMAFTAKRHLDEGKSVYISALTFPERALLNHLYSLFSDSELLTPNYAAGLTIEDLVKTFPVYQLVKFPLVDDGSAYIYHLVKRSGEILNSDQDFKIEGELLTVAEHSGKGFVFAQPVGSEWSGGGHLLSMDNDLNDRIVLNFEIPRATKGKLILRPTVSYDFAKVKFSLLSLGDKTIEVDLYSPRAMIGNPIVLKEGTIPAGKHKLMVEIVGRNDKSQPRYGFGIDYLEVIGAK